MSVRPVGFYLAPRLNPFGHQVCGSPCQTLKAANWSADGFYAPSWLALLRQHARPQVSRRFQGLIGSALPSLDPPPSSTVDPRRKVKFHPSHRSSDEPRLHANEAGRGCGRGGRCVLVQECEHPQKLCSGGNEKTGWGREGRLDSTEADLFQAGCPQVCHFLSGCIQRCILLHFLKSIGLLHHRCTPFLHIRILHSTHAVCTLTRREPAFWK